MKCVMLTLLLAGLLLPGAVRADDDWQQVDCSDTALKFAATDYDVSCKRSSYSGDVYVRIDEMIVLNKKHTDILMLDDTRYQGGYAKRRDLLADVKDFYTDTFDDGWRETGAQQGYDTAEYTGKDDQGNDLDCIAFRRYVSLYTNTNGTLERGATRLVIGFGCSPEGRPHLYDMMKQVQAPGS